MITLKKTTKLRSRNNLKGKTVDKPFNALATVRQWGARGEGEIILVHPEKTGFGYKVIWGIDSDGKTENLGNTKQAVVATNPKIYKTKRACVGALKKVAHVFHYMGTGFGSGIPVYDTEGKKLSLEIKTEYKRVWE